MTRRNFIKASLGTALSLSLPHMGLSDLFAQTLREKEIIPDLAVVTDGDAALMTRQAIELLGGMRRFVSKGDVVVVKPNIGWDRSPEQAADTNPQVVAEVVKLCLESGAKKVKVFDRSCNTANRCYEHSGIKKAASDAGAEVSYVVDAGFSKMKLPQGEVLKQWPLYKPALEADILINVPIAKNHGLTYLTMGIKNLMGIMGGDRGKIHWSIDDKLADLANFVRPQLTILDAYRILVKNGPQGGSLKDVRMKKTIIAGTQIATVDAYGATLFGMKPAGLKHIVKSSKLGLGEIDLSKVNIKKVSLG
ncbi:MAG: cytoplasmic protein [candidate division Zixibacteria bacterium SM23_73_3]|nr:MAG: cytoplasmic protein [candidate division Zixibacteria bacterium SM23_73_3]